MIATILVLEGIMIPPLPPHAVALVFLYIVTVTLLVTDIAKIAVCKLFDLIYALLNYVA
ncbi:MAG: hypothetical protein QW701_05310 [Candidatus Nezhaarchaeales archaeon]